MSPREYAYNYVDAGFSIVPLRLDGSKGPAVESWKQYTERRPVLKEVYEWFLKPAGIGIICGAISEGLEVIDFDMPELLSPLLAMLPTYLVKRLAVYKTPGGWHLAYRCIEVCGNRKLASWEPPKSHSEQTQGHRQSTGFRAIGKGVRIETRGEGGYVVGEGSAVGVHSSGKQYTHHSGPKLCGLEHIEPNDRNAIWQAAMTFDCGHRESAALKRAKQKLYQETHGTRRDESEPWTWFDRFGNIPAILRSNGWESSDNEHWTRPGKNFGTSATLGTNKRGEQVLTVFSSSTELGPINGQSYRCFGAFNLLAELQFNKDRKEAARFVRGLMTESRL